MRLKTLLLAAALAPVSAFAQVDTDASRKAQFGAFVAPAVLPSGSTAVYGFAGAPSIGAGYRQGLGSNLEFDAQFEFDWFQVSFLPTVGIRHLSWEQDKLALAPRLSAGAVLNTGAQWFDEKNWDHAGIRVEPGALLTYRVAETASLIGEFRSPIDMSLTDRGWRVQPLLGGGAELYLGEDITAGIMGNLGVDLLRPPLQGGADVRLGYGVRVGLGWRMF